MTPAIPWSGVLQHPALGQVRYQIAEVSDDPDTQVEQTIDLMKQYAIEDSGSPSFISDVQACAQADPIDDVWRYLSRREGVRSMQFVRDEDTGQPFSAMDRWRPVVETLMRPVDQASSIQPQGDCDDFSMWGAAQLLARGVPVSYVTVAADSRDPSLYSHVYLVAYPKSGRYAGQRVPIDLSHGPYVGWETPNRFGKRREWPVQPESFGLCGIMLLAAGGFLVYRIMRGIN